MGLFMNFKKTTCAILRGSHCRCSLKRSVLKKFANFTGKHLGQSLFLIKLQALACNFIKKDSDIGVFLGIFTKFLRLVSNRIPSGYCLLIQVYNKKLIFSSSTWQNLKTWELLSSKHCTQKKKKLKVIKVRIIFKGYNLLLYTFGNL